MTYFNSISIAVALLFLVGLIFNWKARAHIIPKKTPPRFMFFTGLKPFLDEVGYRQIKASIASFIIGGVILGTSFFL